MHEQLVLLVLDIKWAALVQVTIACCIGHSNGACACPDPL